MREQKQAKQRTQLEEREDQLQQTKDQNMQTWKIPFERDLAAKEEVLEEKRRGMDKTRKTQGLEDPQRQLNESERSRRQLQIKLKELVNTQGTVNKNVHELEKAKRQVEQLEELEDDLQQTKDQKMCLEVNRQAQKTQLERNRTAKEEVREGKRRGMAKKLRDLETESVWDKYNFFWMN